MLVRNQVFGDYAEQLITCFLAKQPVPIYLAGVGLFFLYFRPIHLENAYSK